MKKKKGVTLVELMVVVAILPVLAGFAIPMYNADVNRRSLQEATDTLGAIKDAVVNYLSETGAMPDWPIGFGNYNLNEPGIFGALGVQVPESLGPGRGRKWLYRTGDHTNGGSVNGPYTIRATGQAAADIGSLHGQWVEVQGNWDAVNGEFTAWSWRSSAGIKASWLPD
jgi:prepilin-type N-terminal cleavage/methylation domain-containing protein